MKVFNITDASTSALTSQGLAEQSIKVGDVIIHPGKSAELRGTARERSELQSFLRVGAAAVDELPPAYAARRKLNLDGSPIPVPPPPAPEVVNEPSDKLMLGTEPASEEPPKKGRK